MAKKMNKVMTTNEIEKALLRIEEISAQEKKLADEKKTLTTQLGGQFTQPDNIEEKLKGKTMFFHKIPVNNGKNSFDAATLKSLILGLSLSKNKIGQILRKVLKFTVTVDTDALNALVKEGLVPVEVQNQARIDKWTCKKQVKTMSEASAVEMAS